MKKLIDFGKFVFRSRSRYLRFTQKIFTTFYLVIFLYFLLPISHSLGQTTEFNNGLIITADRIEFNQDQKLMEATGNVQVHFDSKIIIAKSIKYFQKDKKLIIEGQIKVKFGEQIITLANSAELSDDLKSGIIFGANTLINNSFQVRSEKVSKLRDGSSEFFNAITSSCQVCAKQKSPIWDISASKIFHNKKEKVLIFTNAQFSIFGLPIFYTPFLKTPEPGTVRASGFLPPSISYSSSTGLGYKQPYFQVIDPYSDFTFSALFSNNGFNAADFEYRKKFTAGDLALFFEFDPKERSRKFFKTSKIELTSSLPETKTNLSALGFFVPSEGGNKNESYFKINSQTRLSDNMNLSTELINVSNRDLLSTYGYDSKDRLASKLNLTKIEPTLFQEARLSLFTSLRDEDVSGEEPQAFPEVFWRKYGVLKRFGVSYGAETSLLNLIRRKGRDVLRVSSSLDIQKSLYFPFGVKSHNTFHLRGSAYKIGDDASFDQNDVFTIRPLISSDFTLPMVYRSKTLRNTLTPRLQVVYSEAPKSHLIPNEDSVNINFDETNVFSFNRYPGIDLLEEGLRINAGMEFQSQVSKKFGYTFSIGEIFRIKPNIQFSESSGIDGYRSDIILSSRASLKLNYPNIDLSTKLLLDQNMALKLNETSLIWSEENYTNTGSFVYLVKDTSENRPKDQAYLNFGTNFNIGNNWTTSISLNRDFINNYFSSFKINSKYSINYNWTGNILAEKSFSEAAITSSKSGLGLSYKNECLQLDITYTDLINSPDTKKELLFAFSTPLFSLGKGSEQSSGLSFRDKKFSQRSSVCMSVK